MAPANSSPGIYGGLGLPGRETLRLHGVGKIQACRHDLHQHFTRFRFRLRDILQLKHRRPAAVGNNYGFHKKVIVSR